MHQSAYQLHDTWGIKIELRKLENRWCPRCARIKSVDSKLWEIAMKVYMNSMYSKLVWKLVDLLEGIKPIVCKYICKRKINKDGKVETYKARLVAKDEETFSLVAMLKSIHILLSIAVAFDYEICQIDVKTFFLNDYLEESIYMMKPTRYIAKGNDQKVCKLFRSICELKQTSRLWNKRFNKVIKTFRFEQSVDETCVYKCLGMERWSFSFYMLMILYSLRMM
ncbi:gag/pol protein [Gossypium australe]|uniref:Gag/pol protein n=1 Tax=Gossypium australe TaxID=47621 RepID=A0A5B6WRH2_9ROSI|nr:gag/pol protein [Gossypium australe]